MSSHVPHYIRDLLQGRPVDVIIQSSTDYNKKKLGKLMMGVTLAFSWVCLFPFLFAIPLLELVLTGETTITVNGVREIYTRESYWMPILFMLIPTMISSIFIIPVFFLLLKSIAWMRKKGPWYGITNTHLIEIDGSNVSYVPWSEIDPRLQTTLNADGSTNIYLRYLGRKIDHQESDGFVDQVKDSVTSNFHLTLNGKSVDISQMIQKAKQQKTIGILGVSQGKHVVSMLQRNIERQGE